MYMINQKFRKMIFAVSGMTLASFVSFSHAAVDGLELLDAVGEYKGELKVYFAARPTSEQLRHRAKLGDVMGELSGVKFSLDKPIRLGETRTAIKGMEDPSATYEVDQLTGNFLFNSGMQRYRLEGSTKDLPQSVDAVDLSGMLLEEYGLNVDPEQMELAHVGGLNMAISDGAGGSKIFEKLKTVRYSRVLDGLPVEGSARIVVHLGQGGDLAGMVYQWPKIAETTLIDSKQLREPEAIRGRALEQIKAVTQKVESARLTEAKLVLYDDGQGVVEPAYHFVVERNLDYGEREPVMIPYDFYVPVSKTPLARYPFMEEVDVKPDAGQSIAKVNNNRDE